MYHQMVTNHAGIREYARAAGASFGALSEAEVEAWVNQPEPRAAAGRGRGIAELQQQAAAAGGGGREGGGGESGAQQPAYCLFAYPAMDNFGGVLYPMPWVRKVQGRSNATHVWKVGGAARGSGRGAGGGGRRTGGGLLGHQKPDAFPGGPARLQQLVCFPCNNGSLPALPN